MANGWKFEEGTGFADGRIVDSRGTPVASGVMKMDGHKLAAAVDLLAALEVLVDCCQLGDDADWKEGEDPIAAARAAIAKARGAQQ